MRQMTVVKTLINSVNQSQEMQQASTKENLPWTYIAPLHPLQCLWPLLLRNLLGADCLQQGNQCCGSIVNNALAHHANLQFRS